MSKIFDDMMRILKQETQVTTGSVLSALMSAASSAGLIVKKDSGSDDAVNLSLPESSNQPVSLNSNTRVGFYDLKPAFANSSSVKMGKNGNWYVRVPIRRKTKGMGSNLYNRARQISMGGTENMSNLLKERPEMDSPFGQLPSNLNTLTGAQDLSGNLTRVKSPSGNGSNYIAFRTVSANSPSNSWIIKYNMDTEEAEDNQKSLEQIVNGVLK